MRTPHRTTGLHRLAAALRTHPTPCRWLTAGPGAIAAAIATTAAMPLWLPASGASAIAAVALPLVWAVPFFYAVLADDVARAALVLVTATVAQAALVALA